MRVAFNDEGRRIGEGHHRAKIPDAVVHELRDLHEHKGIRYRQLIAIFEERGVKLTYSTVKKICNYMRRNQTAARFKDVDFPNPNA